MISRKTLDELLCETAKTKTNELGLEKYLDSVHASKSYPKAALRHAPLGRIYKVSAIAAAAALVILGAAASFTQAVVVEGKTYLTFGSEIVIDDMVYSLDSSSKETSLIRLMNSNQYVIPKDESVEFMVPTIMVFAPDSKPLPLKNLDSEPSKEEKPLSIEPVTVYPIVGDLKVREGPDTEYSEITTLHSGQCITKIGMYGNWAIIEWNGDIAYAYGAYLYEAPKVLPVYPAVEKFATEPVNVRSLPTSRDESAVLNELQTGERVMCKGIIGDWTQIEWNGGVAYVFSKYLFDKIG